MAALLSVVIAVSILGACSRSAQPPVRRSTVTYHKDIEPILLDHCATCHRPVEAGASQPPAAAASAGRAWSRPGTTLLAGAAPAGDLASRPEPAAAAVRAGSSSGGSSDPLCFGGAPFSLIDYATVRAHAREVARAVTNRAMPPWLPEPGYGSFANERRLTDEQISLIREWVEAGAPEGDPADAPPPRRWPDGWQLGQPDLVLQLPETYTLQAAGQDVFRNFVIPVPIGSTRYVRAVEFQAGSPRNIHHASIGVDRFRVSRRLDRADPEPGFAAMPDDQVENVYGWTPGKAPFMEPEERSWALDKGSDLVLQLHMLPSGSPQPIRPTIGLFFASRPPTRTLLPIKLESKSIDIPAGQSDYAIEDSYLLPADIDVLSVYPHAHYLAREIKGTATLPDGSTQPLIWIRAWDFRWQDQYRYAQPLFLPRGTTVAVRITYDNSDHNPRNPNHPPQRVKWGPRSSDEMGALWLEVLPRHEEDAPTLLRDYQIRTLRADLAGAEMQAAANPEDALTHNFLGTKYLQAGRIQSAIAQFNQALRLKPLDAEAHSNLASALQLQGRLSEALEHARESVRLKPDDDRVRFNLANILSATGQPDAAIRELERALSLNPENADAHFNLAVLLGPRGRVDEAIAHLRRAIAIAPRHAEAHRNLAVALGLQGRLDEAAAEDREALRLQPDWREVQQHLEAVLRAKTARDGARR